MGLFDSLKKIAKVAAPIAGAGIASLLVPGSGFLAPALGGGIGALFGGQKPGQALLTGLMAGAGGKFLGGSKLGGTLGKFAAPVGAAAGAALPSIAVAEQNELMEKMRKMYPNEDEEKLQELVLKQIVKAPTNYEGYEDDYGSIVDDMQSYMEESYDMNRGMVMIQTKHAENWIDTEIQKEINILENFYQEICQHKLGVAARFSNGETIYTKVN